MSWNNSLIKLLKTIAEQAGDVERVVKYEAQLFEAKERDAYSLVEDMDALANYTGGLTLMTPATPPGRCTGCGSSDFKGDRCEWCRSVREWAKT